MIILRRYFQFVGAVMLLSCVLPLIVWVYSILHLGASGASLNGVLTEPRVISRLIGTGLDVGGRGLLGRLLLLLLVTGAALAATSLAWGRLAARLAILSRQQRQFLDRVPQRWVGAAIVASAALSLLLELTLIRWQGTVFETFAFYKNFGLLACFAGLGLGYALSRSDHIPLAATVPTLAWQVALLTITRSGPPGWDVGLLRGTPVLEQLNMGTATASHRYPYAAVMLLLVVTFVLTALALVPIGQTCGALMNRRGQLRAYGLNLAGSIVGVILSLGLSYEWTPPGVWFAVCLLLLLPFLSFDRSQLLSAVVCGTLGLITLMWPFEFPWSRTYSPYQLLETGPDANGHLTLRAAGHYYQRLLDLSDGRVGQTDKVAMDAAKRYYEFPYRIASRVGDVAVVGAGTGNDVAAALREGARTVDAIEIDPAILALGVAHHPERPYQDGRVQAILNDARTHLRTTKRSYDMVVYGLLDSHTMLSHGSNLRLDSFVYTVGALREARQRLRDGGLLSLSFAVLSPEIGRKVYLMLQEAFDGRPPVCIAVRYDGSVIFLQRKGGDLVVPAQAIESAGFSDVTRLYADASIRADVSTDDWPFFYMPRRDYPLSYLVVVALMLVLAVGMTLGLARLRPHRGQAELFFLGAGFMLVETKNITELGLTFGNTWQVIGIVIVGILMMGFAANVVVERRAVTSSAVPYVLLLCTLTFGAALALRGGFLSTPQGRLEALFVLSCPLFFSGLAFSAAIQHCESLSDAMAANLIGAMCGGLLEYNSMYFGFTFMYWIALGLYGTAMLFSLRRAGVSQRDPQVAR